MLKIVATAIALLITVSACPAHKENGTSDTPINKEVAPKDTVAVRPDTIIRLTEEDYIEVAERLRVETAAIKAVVDIEAGKAHEGFTAPGTPIVNFDYSMFSLFAKRNGVNLAKYRKTHPVVFSSAVARKHGPGQKAENAQLKAARAIDERTAVEGTFWGMFQIGGFNWKKCGAESIEDFEEKMSRSERDQLDLFANFIVSTGLDKHLKNKNWAAFARGYNGPSYASRGYHTKMATAYNRHKSLEKKSAK